MRVEQTIHGYREGHRLLASSGGANPDELDSLDRLSDLSGYLPAGLHYDHYFTGFPCGRFYAFACTWPDVNASRSGTVLTHTLLAPLHECSTLPDLFALHDLHSFPREDLSLFTKCLDWDVPAMVELSPPDAIRDSVAMLIFGQAQRPIVWIDDSEAVIPLRWAWRLLWPKARTNWAFCTLALQPRSISKRPFSWLSAPPQARSGLHRLANTTSWWDRGRLLDRKLRGRSSDAWVADFRTISAPRQLVDRVFEAGLSQIPPHQLLLAKRFFELEAPAKQRLPAARTRADLLQQLAPTFQDAPSVWHQTLETLMHHQAEAPLDPRPLWNLEDLLSRLPLQQALNNADESIALGQDLRKIVRQEIGRRILARPKTAMAVLIPLDRQATACGLSAATLSATSEALERLLSGSEEQETTVDQIRQLVRDNDASAPLVAALILPLPVSEQRRILTDIINIERESEFLGTLNEELKNAELAYEFHLRRGGDPLAGLEMAARIHANEQPDQQWERVLAATTPEIAWRWSLMTPNASPTMLQATWTWCGRDGDATLLGEIAADTRLGGNAILVASPTLSMAMLEEVFRKHPQLAVKTTMAGLQESGWEVERVVRLAVESIPASTLLEPDVLAVLDVAADSRVVDDILERLLPTLVQQIFSRADDDPIRFKSWFRAPAFQQFITRASTHRISNTLRQVEIHGDTIATRLTPFLETLEPTSFEEMAWSIALLTRLLRQADSTSLLSATDPLSQIFDLQRSHGYKSEDTMLSFMGEVLGAIRRTRCHRCTPLIVASFYPVYQRLVEDRPGPLRDCQWWSELWWDRAKHWRHWLLDFAVEADWPGEIMRTATRENPKLLNRLKKRAKKNDKSRAYWARTQG